MLNAHGVTLKFLIVTRNCSQLAVSDLVKVRAKAATVAQVGFGLPMMRKLRDYGRWLTSRAKRPAA